jgi:hypothetical protein
VKLLDMQAEQSAFKHRSLSRITRLQGLIDMFQSGYIDAKRFRHLTRLLRAEQHSDSRATGFSTEKITTLL